MQNIREIAKSLAQQYKLPVAEVYDLVPRADGMIELIGLVPETVISNIELERKDPTLIPKRWITLEVFDKNTEVAV